jgi:DNA-binding IclR family transcriptional regulator
MNTTSLIRDSEKTRIRTVSDTGTGTVLRVVRLLGALSEYSHDVSLSELSEKLKLPASTVHRLLDLLSKEGMVERDQDLRLYRPGLEFYRIASSIHSKRSIQDIAMRFLKNAVLENDENAYLGILDLQAKKMMMAAVAESSHLLSYRVVLNELLPLVKGASALAMTAWLEESECSQVIEQSIQAGIIANHDERLKILDELIIIRQQGFAISFGERIKGAVGIFAPVFNAQSRVIGSLGYTVPEMRFQKANLPKLSATAINQAQLLSNALGFNSK